MLTTRDDSTGLDNSPPVKDVLLVEETSVFARHYSLNEEECWKVKIKEMSVTYCASIGVICGELERLSPQRAQGITGETRDHNWLFV
jgi:hypothetical protein